MLPLNEIQLNALASAGFKQEGKPNRWVRGDQAILACETRFLYVLIDPDSLDTADWFSSADLFAVLLYLGHE